MMIAIIFFVIVALYINIEFPAYKTKGASK